MHGLQKTVPFQYNMRMHVNNAKMGLVILITNTGMLSQRSPLKELKTV